MEKENESAARERREQCARAVEAAARGEGTLYVVANAHLDTQWNWTVRDTISRYLRPTLEENFALFERFPDYVMNFEGAFRYALMKEYFPDLFERLRGYVASGRWKVAGSTWDAMDANIPSSEALMRQVLLGNGFFEREFGVRSSDIFLADCFGFRAALPSIAAHMGLTGFSTQKLVWGAGSPILRTDGSAAPPLPGGGNVRMDLGRWRGPDGGEILVSLLEGNYTYRFERDGDTPIAAREDLARDISRNARYAGAAKHSMYYGTGDTGGSAGETSARMVQEAVDATRAGARGGEDGAREPLFRVVSASTSQIFEDLTPQERAALPVYEGGLLIPHGYGAMTSHTASKRFNRRGEGLALAAERACLLASSRTGRDYPAERLRGAWEMLLWHQFHDDLPGTAIAEAYAISHNDYAIVRNLLQSELSAAITSTLDQMDTCGQGLPLALFNPAAVAREDPLTLTLPRRCLPENPSLRVEAGGETLLLPVDSEQSEDGESARVTFSPPLSPLSLTVASLVSAGDAPAGEGDLTYGENFLENSALRVELDGEGNVCRIFDKVHGFEALSGPIRLVLLPDNNTHWPSWELRYEDQFEQGEPVGEVPRIFVRGGRASAEIAVTRAYRGSTFICRVILGARSRRVDLRFDIDWQERATLLQAVFPLGVKSDTALFDQGYGAVRGGDTTSYPYFRHNVHEWASITSGGRGVAVCNDGKYAMGKPNGHTLTLDLIHTPKGEFLPESAQDRQDLGKNLFTLSVYPFEVREDGTTGVPEEAEKCNTSVVALAAPSHEGGGRAASLLAGEISPGVILRAAKKEERGQRIILRVQECEGVARARVRLPLAFDALAAEETNGYEERVGDAALEDGALIFPLGKYECKTFALAPRAHAAAPRARHIALNLPYSRKVTSPESDPAAGELIPGSGVSIPEQLFPHSLVCGGVPYTLGDPRGDNAAPCAGQTLVLPAGCRRVHLLLSSVAGDRQAAFTVDGRSETRAVQDVREDVGAWDQASLRKTPLYKPQPIGTVISHLHRLPPSEASASSTAENEAREGGGLPNCVLPYTFAYLFTASLPGGRELTLPRDENILLFAATAECDPE